MAPSEPSHDKAQDAADDCAARLRVLAEETRLEVLRELMKGPRRVGQLNESIDIPQSLLSHHLRVLREAGMVEAERDGRAVLYRISSELLGGPRGGEGIDLGCCRLSFE